MPGAHWASEEYPLNPEHPVPALLGTLARAGIANVSVERSGVGDSEGPACSRVGFQAELSGYHAGLRWLRGEEWARKDAIFLFGHSVGAMVAPLLAAEVDVSGVIAFGAGSLRISEHFHGDEAHGRVITFFQELERQGLAAAWQCVRAPVLVAHGANDSITTLEDAHAIARRATHAEVLELEGVDHHMSDVRGVGRAARGRACASRRFRSAGLSGSVIVPGTQVGTNAPPGVGTAAIYAPWWRCERRHGLARVG